MALVFSQDGMEVVGDLVSNNATLDNVDIRLFQNDITPTTANVAADFTEATFTGYASVELTPANWGVTKASTTVFLYDTAVAFTSSAGSQNENIYGYYITRATDGVLLWSERFSDAPNNIVNNGDVINVTSRFTLANAGSA